jgi:translation elongation factor EF-1alpha
LFFVPRQHLGFPSLERNNAMRVPFSDVFEINPNGSVSPRTRVRIGGVTMGSGVSFGRGAFFGGVELASYIEHDLEIEYEGDIVVIKGAY